MLGQGIPPSHEDMQTYIEKPKPIKHYCVVLCVFLKILQKMRRHVGPMHLRIDMVCHVVPIVKCVLIVKVVHRLKRKRTIKLVAFQFLGHCSYARVNEDMLRKIPKH